MARYANPWLSRIGEKWSWTRFAMMDFIKFIIGCSVGGGCLYYFFADCRLHSGMPPVDHSLMNMCSVTPDRWHDDGLCGDSDYLHHC